MKVIPAIGSDDCEIKYQGGYNTVTYGSMSGGTVDAIQLEFGKELRAPTADTANQLTKAIAQGEFGRDGVVCFSPHPEKTKGLEALVRYAIEHVDQSKAGE